MRSYVGWSLLYCPLIMAKDLTISERCAPSFDCIPENRIEVYPLYQKNINKRKKKREKSKG